jgi:hypothetical protein
MCRGEQRAAHAPDTLNHNLRLAIPHPVAAVIHPQSTIELKESQRLGIKYLQPEASGVAPPTRTPKRDTSLCGLCVAAGGSRLSLFGATVGLSPPALDEDIPDQR